MSAALHTSARWPGTVVQPLLGIARMAARAGQPLAIAGVPGSGKSTLAAQLAGAATAAGINAAVLSLDDVYLDRPERERLAREVHPLLALRGPPGTHDAGLACDVIDRLTSGGRARLPRFDKGSDRRLPESRWPLADGIGLLVVEGWGLRVPAQAAGALDLPVNVLEAHEDADGAWRRHCNAALARDYPALWSRLPTLALLHAPSFDVVPRWRWQRECALRRAGGAPCAMTRPDVLRFVQLFERLGRHALAVLPGLATHVVRLDARRRPLPADAAGAGLPTMRG